MFDLSHSYNYFGIVLPYSRDQTPLWYSSHTGIVAAEFTALSEIVATLSSRVYFEPYVHLGIRNIISGKPPRVHAKFDYGYC